MERSVFPRRCLGESLTPGVLPLLASIGAGPAIERAAYPRARKVSVRWETERERENSESLPLLVDRGHFDRLLLEHARGCGVRVLQPARVEKVRRDASGWNLIVSCLGRTSDLKARFVADASGRASLLRRQRRPTGPRTFALHAYWTGRGLPDHPRIEAGHDRWYWGLPLPDGLYNTLVFLDPRTLAAMSGTLETRFRKLIAESSLMPDGTGARLIGRVRGTDATPHIEEQCVTEDSILVGDAALSLDPLSSSGVQKAIQSALSGSVVVNTLLQRPESSEIARRFYRENLAAASARHREWAQGHYARVAAGRGTRFWRERSADKIPLAAAHIPPETNLAPDVPLRLSPESRMVDVPCIVEKFVETRAAVCAPGLGGPVAYLGAWELAPLLRGIRSGMTLRELVGAWRPLVPPTNGRAIAQWLVSRGLLVASADGPAMENRGAG